MKLRAVIALVLLGGLGAIVYFAATAHEDTGGTGAGSSGSQFTSSEQCASCHRAVYDEWKTSYHGLSWTDPLVRAPEKADNFSKKDCIPCHAPRPVFEHGIGKDARVVPRTANRHEGVDCLACHKMGNQMAATRDGNAKCMPAKNDAVGSTALCAPCHNQHKTVDEWEATEFAKNGTSCSDCHMPPVDRPATADHVAYQGRSHVWPGSHSLDMLKRSVTVTCDLRAGDTTRALVVTVANVGAGHNVPSDARHRALDLVVTLIDKQGRPVAGTDTREAGQEPGTQRLRFRNPYRTESGKVDTQIRAGTTATLEVPLAAEIKSAHVQLIYKLTPFVADPEGTLLFERTIEVGS
jgi:nitrate/TMAO reductase-like tetraheme cytochrome c subunit